MVYAYIEDVPVPEEIYREVIERLGSREVPGLLVHLCIRRPDGGLRYLDVWESEEISNRSADEVLHPVLLEVFAAHGFALEGTPVLEDLDVINVLHGSAGPDH